MNLLPLKGKVCSFDCIYCECGWNSEGRQDTRIPSLEQVQEALERGLRECHRNNAPIDSITFSGNGEPTLHPDFPEIIDYTVALRDELFPEAVISVPQMLLCWAGPESKRHYAGENPILKLDGVDMDYVRFSTVLKIPITTLKR